MLLYPSVPATPTATDSKETLSYLLPSPVGGSTIGARLGVAASDTTDLFAGLNYETPISLGVHLVSIRGDGDLWRATTGKSRGGAALAADAIFGPSSSYQGAGIAYAARYGHASGPAGVGLKVLMGSQILPVVGYEISATLTGKGSMIAAMATFKLG